MLSTMLLADAVKVNKGGPGSGPQSGKGGKTHADASALSSKARDAGRKANDHPSIKNHLAAAKAHGAAADAHFNHGNEDRGEAHVEAQGDHYRAADKLKNR